MSTASTKTACQRAGIMRARTRRSRSNAPTADCATGWPGSAGALVSFPDPRRWSTVPLPWSPTCTSTRKSTQASFTYHLPEQRREFGGNARKIHHSPGTPSELEASMVFPCELRHTHLVRRQAILLHSEFIVGTQPLGRHQVYLSRGAHLMSYLKDGCTLSWVQGDTPPNYQNRLL